MKGWSLFTNILTAIVGLLFGIVPLIIGYFGSRIIEAFSSSYNPVDRLMYLGIGLLVAGFLNLVLGIAAHAGMKHSLFAYTITEMFLAGGSAAIFGWWFYEYFKNANYDLVELFSGKVILSVYISGIFFALNALSFVFTILYALVHAKDKKKAMKNYGMYQ